jgi:hypothetical protein
MSLGRDELRTKPMRTAAPAALVEHRQRVDEIEAFACGGDGGKAVLAAAPRDGRARPDHGGTPVTDGFLSS